MGSHLRRRAEAAERHRQIRGFRLQVDCDGRKYVDAAPPLQLGDGDDFPSRRLVVRRHIDGRAAAWHQERLVEGGWDQNAPSDLQEVGSLEHHARHDPDLAEVDRDVARQAFRLFP
jgi:hypothetical protein